MEFKSPKPKPAWMTASQTLADASGFPASAITPDIMLSPLGSHIADKAAGPNLSHPNPGTLNAEMQLRSYGNTKKAISGNLPPDSDSIVDLPYSEKKKK